MNVPPTRRQRQGLIPRILTVLLGMNGIVPRQMTALRWAAILGSFALYNLFAGRISAAGSLSYFIAATILHFAYLFGMFRAGGWSRKLRQRSGDERGYIVHTGWTAFVFCHNALSIGAVCVATGGLPLLGVSIPADPSWLRTALGVGLVVAGLGVKIWTTLIVGLDTYYYRDLFLERREGTMSAVGPYRWFRNPMYTVGHLQAYGLALLTASAWGVLAVALNQALVLIFNATIEQPHVRRMQAGEVRLAA